MGESLTEIEVCVHGNSLDRIDNPRLVTTIGYRATACAALEAGSIGANVAEIGEYAFSPARL
ncbi:MAG: hypothetical protein ACLRSW_16375 [Christensenellaceae bacterium]